MQSYPVSYISSPDNQVNILQITDLHLSAYSAEIDAKPNCQRNFEQVLAQALAENERCDLILVTGDLVSKVDSALYDYIFKVLAQTQIPFVCIAGNHDVTDELGHDLPFEQRKFVARRADPRLLNQHIVETDYWQILLLNSAVPGKVAGEIDSQDIAWLSSQLSRCDKPALLAIHHHILPMHSDWIDTHMLQNTALFWQSMAPFRHLKAIVNGHTHQERVHRFQDIVIYTTPSTCYQYQPLVDNFAYDTEAQPGYRWLQLANNGQLASWVKRLDT